MFLILASFAATAFIGLASGTPQVQLPRLCHPQTSSLPTRRSIDDETIDDEESRISSRLDEEENGRGGVSINKECLDEEVPRASEVMKVVLDVVGEWWVVGEK